MGQVIKLPTEYVEKPKQDEALAEYMTTTMCRILHPSAGNLSDGQRRQILQKAIDLYEQAKSQSPN